MKTTISNFFEPLNNLVTEEVFEQTTMSTHEDLASKIQHSNELLAMMLQAIQAGQTEQRIAVRESKATAEESAREAREATAEILKVVQVSKRHYNDDKNESRRDEIETSRARPSLIQNQDCRGDEEDMEEQVNTDFNDETSDEEQADDEFGDWPEDEDEEEEEKDEPHDQAKCKNQRNRMRKTIKKLNKKVKDVETEMKNIKKAVNLLSMKNVQKATIATRVQNNSYAQISSKNTDENHAGFPTLGAAKNLNNIYKTPAVLPIQKRTTPTEQTSQERIEEQFRSAACQIGFKPITFAHINKEKAKLNEDEKQMDEEEQMDIVTKKLIEEFMIRDMGIPAHDAETMITQIESIHPPVTTEPNTWDILYVKFTSINIVNRIWSYAPQLPKETPENQIKVELRKYIPSALYDNYKAIEAIAYDQRRNHNLQTKITIGKDKFVLKCRQKTQQREPWKNIPEHPTDNIPKIIMSPRPRQMNQPERRTPTYKTTTLAPQTKPAPAVENSPKKTTQSDITKENTETMDIDIETNNKRLMTPEEQTTNKSARVREAPPNDIGEKDKNTMTTFAIPHTTSKRNSINTGNKVTPQKTISSPSPVTPRKKPQSLEESTRRRSTMTARSPIKKTNKQ